MITDNYYNLSIYYTLDTVLSYMHYFPWFSEQHYEVSSITIYPPLQMGTA